MSPTRRTGNISTALISATISDLSAHTQYFYQVSFNDVPNGSITSFTTIDFTLTDTIYSLSLSSPEYYSIQIPPNATTIEYAGENFRFTAGIVEEERLFDEEGIECFVMESVSARRRSPASRAMEYLVKWTEVMKNCMTLG